MRIVLAILCVVVAAIRFFVPTHGLSLSGSYEAFAHLLVGGLIGAALVSRDLSYWILVAALSGVELVAFFLKH